MVRHFRVFGLTGIICSGKSFVSNYLKTYYGVSVISIDDINKTVLDMPTVRIAIRRLFGDEVFIKDPNDESKEILDKAKIRRIIYDNPQKKRRLENITHLKVFILFLKMLFTEKFKRPEQIVIIENAILLRFAVFRFLCYKIISVCVNNKSSLIARIMKRDECSYEMAESIIQNQMSNEEFQKKSDRVIFNDGSEMELRRKVDALYIDLAQENSSVF